MSGDIMITGARNIAMTQLLVMRGRLHVELGTGMTSRVSTVVGLQRQGVTKRRTRWGALYDLNQHIREQGGPPDRRGLILQKRLTAAGKDASYPPKK